MSVLHKAFQVLEVCDVYRTTLHKFGNRGDIIPCVTPDDFPESEFKPIAPWRKNRWHMEVNCKTDNLYWKRKGFRVYQDLQGSIWILDTYWNNALRIGLPCLMSIGELNAIAAQTKYNIDLFLAFLGQKVADRNASMSLTSKESVRSCANVDSGIVDSCLEKDHRHM